MHKKNANPICRTCLNYSSSYVHIFTEMLEGGYVYEVLRDVCQLEVSSDDGLPEFVCCDCHKKLSDFHSFKLLTHEGYAALIRIKEDREMDEMPRLILEDSEVEEEVAEGVDVKPEVEYPLDICEGEMDSGADLRVVIKSEPDDFEGKGRDDCHGLDMQVVIKQELEIPLDLDAEESIARKGAQEQSFSRSAAVTGPLDKPNGEDKDNLRERILRKEAQSMGRGEKGICGQNLASKVKGFGDDGTQVLERGRGLRDVLLTRFSDRSVVCGNGEEEDGEDLIDTYSDIGDFNACGHSKRFSDFNACRGTDREGIRSAEKCDSSVGTDMKLERGRDKGEVGGADGDSIVNLCEGEYECGASETDEHNARVNMNAALTSRDKNSSSDGTYLEFKLAGRTRVSHCGEGSMIQLNKGGDRDLVVCDLCGKEYLDKRDLHCHLVGHSKQSDFGSLSEESVGAGDEISKVQVSKESVRNRKERVRWKCKWCCKEFTCESVLKRHETVHTGEKPYVCEICSKGFSLKSSLVRHQLVHTREKPFSCQYCSKHFGLKSSLNSHQLIHTGAKPFSCRYCPKTFNVKGNRNNHERIHSGAKPFSCRYCPKTFNVKGNLDNHERIHTGVKPFSCKYCSKSFAGKSNLAKHELIHTGVKRHACQVCGKRFFLRWLLRDHERTHFRKKQFECEICGKKYKYDCSRQKHQKMHEMK